MLPVHLKELLACKSLSTPATALNLAIVKVTSYRWLSLVIFLVVPAVLPVSLAFRVLEACATLTTAKFTVQKGLLNKAIYALLYQPDLLLAAWGDLIYFL